MMDSFRERLEHWMVVRGTNPKRLSKDASLHETAVRDILKRTESPGIDRVAKICLALDIYPHELVPEFAELYPPKAIELMGKLIKIREEQRSLKKELEALKE